MRRTPANVRTSIRMLSAGVVVGCATVMTLSPQPATSAPTTSFSVSSLDVVGGPEAGEGSAVVLVDHQRRVYLDGISPNSGAVTWTHPFSGSGIIPFVALDPYVIDNVVIDLIPVGKPTNPLVNVDGVNATTGAIAWRGPQGVLVGDSRPCQQLSKFCVILFNRDGSTSMGVLNPSSGQVLSVVKGTQESLDSDLFWTTDKAETLEELTMTGTVAWKKTVTQLFGKGFDLNNGWLFTTYGSTEVATVGPNAQDHSFGLDNAKTIGISVSSGTTSWSLNGQFQCGGTLTFEDPAFACVTTGKLAHPNSNSYKGLSLKLQGFNPATGATTWTVPVRNIDAIENGNAAFVDNTHIVVQLENGTNALLDTNAGTTTPMAKGEIVWCSAPQVQFQINENSQINSTHERTSGVPVFPCTSNGKAVDAVPLTTPTNVGVTVDGVFLWAAPHGLARHTVGSATGAA